jgi:3-oxoacyl-[acyl-carrier protein] reductase
MAVALIVGGAGMLGRGTARCLVQEGWQVVVADIDLDEAEKVAAEINSPKVTAEGVDARNLDTVKQAVDRVVDTFGTLDGMVNCAGGRREPKREFGDSEPEHWDLLIDTLIKTTYIGCYAALPVMLKQGHGAVVNFSSAAGLRDVPPHLRQKRSAVYGAVKAGIIAFTQAMAQEVGTQGIRVNAIAPYRSASRGKTEADMIAMEEREEAEQKGSSRRSPLGRLSNIDVGNAVAFLLSERASHISGSCIDMSGGICLH